MTTLFTALGTQINNIQLGENMNQEYSWSENLTELITQFSFQLTRTSNITELEKKYQEILKKIFIMTDKTTDKMINPNTSAATVSAATAFLSTTTVSPTEYIKLIYKLIGYTRDVVSGKGEYNLAYMLISGLYKFSQSTDCPDNDRLKISFMATTAIESLVRTEINEHPYGSWKDMKYFCNYHIPKEYRTEAKLKDLNDPLFNKVIELICGQLQCDEKSPVKTLAAKWIPREKSDKFGWITPILATKYYSKWYTESLTSTQKTAARRKCLTHFRQLVSKINKELNTPQINQCNGTWSNIDFDKNVTSITLRKQSKAFQGNNKFTEDRAKCAENYKQYADNCKIGKSVAKGKRVSVIDFVRDALRLNPTQSESTESTEKDMINAQWKDNGKQNLTLENCIAMIDTSASMETDNCVPLYSAIGLGIRIAEMSKFGKRVLTFSSSPTWVNLDSSPDFVSMVHKVRAAPWGQNTNFRAALDMILDTAIQNSIHPIDMREMVLIILSDMQIDYANTESSTMFEIMKQKYHDAGVRSIYKQPYELPHIIFWNLRSTSGFPSLSTTENVSMMSGNNPVLLNTFCNKGVEALNELSPWKMLTQELSNKRYNYLENIVDNLWTKQ
jgi:hypothetical protein